MISTFTSQMLQMIIERKPTRVQKVEVKNDVAQGVTLFTAVFEY